MSLQIGYTYLPQYKVSKDIQSILENTFGENIAVIIKMYLPLFHDETQCSSGILVTDEFIKRFQNDLEIELMAQKY